MKIKVKFLPLVGLLIFITLCSLTKHPPTSADTHLPYENPQLYFVENAGQFAPGIYYQVQTTEGVLQIAEDGLWWTLTRPNDSGEWQAVTIQSQFQQANWTKPAPLHPIDTTFSYYTPDGLFAGVPVWSGVFIPALYPGLDLQISGENGRITLQFTETTANHSQPHLQISGATLLPNEPNITLSTPLGDWSLPITSDGHLPITLNSGEEVQTTIIPSEIQTPANQTAENATNLIFSTFLGGSQDDQGNKIASHSNGFIYAIGEYLSISDFPRPTGRVELLHNIDSYVAKIQPDGTSFDFIFHVMASLEEAANGLKISSSGDVYVTGRTSSSDFPTTPGAYDRTPNGAGDVWVIRLDGSGQIVRYSTLLGDDRREWATDLDIDSAGNAYITGLTESPSFPTTPGAFDRTWNGNWDAFIAKFDRNGANLLYSTYMGGASEDSGQAIEIASNGEMFITGYTFGSGTFPSTATIGSLGGIDAFTARLNPPGNSAVYITTFGGSLEDRAMDLDLDNSGRPVIAGFTDSNNFPTTAGAFDESPNGGLDAFVVRMAANGSGLGYATYLGGSGLDKALGLSLDGVDRVYVSGETNANNFPVTANAYDNSYNGGLDIFLAKLDSSASDLLYGSYIGAANDDSGRAIAVECADLFLVTGFSSSAAFPTTSGAIDPTFNGGLDVVIFKLQIFNQPLPPPLGNFNVYLPSIPYHDPTTTCPSQTDSP